MPTDPFASIRPETVFPGRSKLYAFECAGLLGISTQQVVNLARAGSLEMCPLKPGEKAGQGNIKITPEALNAFINERASA